MSLVKYTVQDFRKIKSIFFWILMGLFFFRSCIRFKNKLSWDTTLRCSLSGNNWFLPYETELFAGTQKIVFADVFR